MIMLTTATMTFDTADAEDLVEAKLATSEGSGRPVHWLPIPKLREMIASFPDEVKVPMFRLKMAKTYVSAVSRLTPVILHMIVPGKAKLKS